MSFDTRSRSSVSHIAAAKLSRSRLVVLTEFPGKWKMKCPGASFFNGPKGGPLFQYLAVCTGTLNVICSGLQYGWPSPSLPQLLSPDSQIPMSGDQGSWIAVMILLGGASGAIFAGVILDKLGRKGTILLTSVPNLIAWMMIAYARSFGVLLAARYIAGISDGMVFCSVPMYIGEIAHPKVRGLLGSSITVMMMLGILLINVIGAELNITNTALVCSSIPILLVLTFSWMPESPYFLLMKGKRDQAKESLMKLRGTVEVEAELTRLAEAVEEQNSATGRYLDLFTVKSNRMAVYVVMITRTAQQCSGITAFTFYAQTVFKEAGDTISPVAATIVYYAVQIIFSGISAVIVDKTGRRPLMIISTIGSSIVLLIEACYFYVKNVMEVDTSSYAIVPIIALIVFVIIFNVGMQTIPLLLIGELFPTNVKAFALTYSDIYYCLVTTAISKFFQFTKDEFGLHVPFFVFTACGVIGLLFIAFFVPETKGKTLEKIQQDLKGGPGKEKMVELPESVQNSRL